MSGPLGGAARLAYPGPGGAPRQRTGGDHAMYQPSFEGDEFHRPVQHYEIRANGRRILYAYIRKNACTSFKHLIGRRITWQSLLNRATGGPRARDPEDIRSLRPFRVSAPRAAGPEFDARVFVWRDPLERAVSTYLNKMVDRSGAGDFHANWRTVTGTDPETATFADYVAYVEEDFGAIDVHCMPQKAHLFAIPYTHAIPMSDLRTGIADVVGERLAERHFSRPRNATEGSGGAGTLAGDLSGRPAAELAAERARGARLDRQGFLTGPLTARLEARYAADREMIAKVERKGGAGRESGAAA